MENSHAQNKLKLFENKKIRYVWNDEEEPSGFEENKDVAVRGGKVANTAVRVMQQGL